MERTCETFIKGMKLNYVRQISFFNYENSCQDSVQLNLM